MGLFDQFPYTNFHELNLDWILQALKELEHTIDQFVSINALKYADPIQWDITSQYEKNTIVIDPQTGTAYISVQPVPIGVSLTNPDYWTVVFDLGSFVVRAAKNLANTYEAETTLTATVSTPAGGWIVWGDTLYKALVNITAGDSYVEGGNIQHFTIEEVIGHLEDLDTTDKSNLVAAINEIAAEVLGKIGDLADLNTTDKSNLVAAINEVLTILGTTTGDLADLVTTDKSNLVAAINEVADGLVMAGTFTTPEKFGAYGDGIHDDTVAIQAAIDSGARNVVFANKYLITDTIRIAESQMLVGFYSLITTEEDIVMFDATDRTHWTIQGLHLVKGENNNSLHIVASGANWTIRNCKLTNDVPADFSNWIGGISVSQSTDGLHDNFCGRIENCHIVRGNITINNHTDGFMINNIIWANSGTLSPARYGVDLVGSSWLVSGNQIVGGTSGAMHVEGTQEQILDNFFDGSYATLNTGKGLIATNCGEGLIIQGNKFYNQYSNAIQLTSCQQVLINGNTFRNNNRSGTAYNEIEVNQQTYGNRHVITSNTFVYNNDSIRPYNILNQYTNDIITLKNNYITGYTNAANAYCYVNYKTIISEGNIINGRLYVRYAGTVHACNSNYGISVPLVMTAASLHTVYINGTVDGSYSATTSNGTLEIVKGDNGNLNKAIVAIVSYYQA